MSMKALVTGSAGFIGRHFVAELESRGWEVQGCDLGYRPISAPPAEDIFRKWTGRFDLVVHAAARAPHRVAIDTQPAGHIYNQMLDAAMFDWAVRTKQRRVLYLSSCAVFDMYPDAYGQLKLAGERMAAQAREADVPVTVVRPYSGYGEDQGMDWPFGAFIDRAKRKDDPFEIWGNGRQVRDWIHVDDVVNGALAVVDANEDQPISLCTGVGTSMLDLAMMICDAVEVAESPFLRYRPAFDRKFENHVGASHRVGNPTQMLRLYEPKVSLDEGIRRAMNYVR